MLGHESPHFHIPVEPVKLCDCGAPAMAVLVYVKPDGTEEGRSKPKCKYHYQVAVNIWDRIHAVSPDAFGDLELLVAGA